MSLHIVGLAKHSGIDDHHQRTESNTNEGIRTDEGKD